MRRFWNGNKKPKKEFQKTLEEIKGFSEFAKQQTCPNCNQKGKFKVGKFERGKDGWELTVLCQCGLGGVLNTTGFSFEKREVRTKK